jgi:hypothetical protein
LKGFCKYFEALERKGVISKKLLVIGDKNETSSPNNQ